MSDPKRSTTTSSQQSINVMGTPLQSCCTAPRTGFFRDGFCHTGPMDQGKHVVCAQVTDEFLQYSRQRGNDLSTPRPEFDFPGLVAGDHWCLCVDRWLEAYHAGVAPPVRLEATHFNALEVVTIDMLRKPSGVNS